MKRQALFSSKDKSKKIKVSSAAISLHCLRVLKCMDVFFLFCFFKRYMDAHGLVANLPGKTT